MKGMIEQEVEMVEKELEMIEQGLEMIEQELKMVELTYDVHRLKNALRDIDKIERSRNNRESEILKITVLALGEE